MTRKHLKTRLQSWRLRDYEVPFIATTPISTLTGIVVPDRVASMHQIELCNHLTVCKQMTNAKLNCQCYIAIFWNHFNHTSYMYQGGFPWCNCLHCRFRVIFASYLLRQKPRHDSGRAKPPPWSRRATLVPLPKQKKMDPWRLGRCEVPFIATTPISTLTGIVVPDRVASMHQIELCNHLTVCKQMTNAKLNCQCYIAIFWNHLTISKQKE